MWNVSFSAILIISQLFIWAIFVYCCYLKCLCVYVVLRALAPPSLGLIDEFELVCLMEGRRQHSFDFRPVGLEYVLLSVLLFLAFSFLVRPCWSHPLSVHWLKG